MSRDDSASMPPMPSRSRDTRDFLLRGFPVEVADKLKVAATLHGQPMRDYLLTLIEAHLKELEKKGITLSLPKGR